jgi:uncharacterized integral membrane protein
VKLNIRLIGAILLIALFGIFMVQNAEVVELRLLFWKIAMSRALMFMFIALIGFIIGWLLRSHSIHK